MTGPKIGKGKDAPWRRVGPRKQLNVNEIQGVRHSLESVIVPGFLWQLPGGKAEDRPHQHLFLGVMLVGRKQHPQPDNLVIKIIKNI